MFWEAAAKPTMRRKINHTLWLAASTVPMRRWFRERMRDACHQRGAPRKCKILLRSTKSKLIFHKRQTASLVELCLVALLGSDSWQRMCTSTLPHTHSRMYLHQHTHTHTRRSLQTLACTEAAINFQCALYAPPLQPRPGGASGRNGERSKAC